jgi:hypothetical protein
MDDSQQSFELGQSLQIANRRIFLFRGLLCSYLSLFAVESSSFSRIFLYSRGSLEIRDAGSLQAYIS